MKNLPKKKNNLYTRNTLNIQKLFQKVNSEIKQKAIVLGVFL